MSQSAPDTELAEDDPGDETARRYRFQYTWAAVVCCMLLDETQDAVEVFCEHHEDILLKHRDGQFSGLQVKTRESDQPVWKTSDAQVLGALGRFARLEATYPGRFRAFRFLTNHPLHVADTAQSIGYVLREVEGAEAVSDLPTPVGKLVSRIARETGVSPAIVLRALKKTTASSDLPKLNDASIRLIQTLTNCWAGAKDCSHEAVARAAQALIEECSKASTLDHLQLLAAYIVVVHQPDAAVIARIDGKRMTAIRVRDVLDVGISATASLSGDPARWAHPGQGSTELLMKKLSAGGFSAVSCNSAEDLRDKADYLGILWTKKFGQSQGLERYQHVRSLALSDAARAFEATKSESQVFGPAMREDLRRRFQQRRADRETVFDCSNEHLEGFAYSLTAQCKIQWSVDRPWEDA